MASDDLIQLELMLNRFKKLMGEVSRGAILRNSFQAWEVEILIDIQNCTLSPRRRSEILRRYERAVERQMAYGPGPPMKLSEYLGSRGRRKDEEVSG